MSLATVALLVLGSGLQRHELENGLTVLLRPVPGVGLVAVEAVYEAGWLDDPRGAPLASDLLAELAGELEPEPPELAEAWRALREGGRFGAACGPALTSFEQVVGPAQLEVALRIEAQRLQGISIGSEALELAVARRRQALAAARGRGRGGREADLGHAFAVLVQGWRHALPSVELSAAASAQGADELAALGRRLYRPERGTLVLVGEIDPSEALLLVRRHVGLARIPALAEPAVELDWDAAPRRTTQLWDGGFAAVCVASPPPGDALGRLQLALWGPELQRRLWSDPNLREVARSVHASSPLWSPGPLPAFVWAIATEGVGAAQLQPVLAAALTAALETAPTEIELLRQQARARSLASASELLSRDSLAAERLRQESLGHDPEEALRIVLARFAGQLARADRLFGEDAEPLLQQLARSGTAGLHALLRDRFSERSQLVTLLEVFPEGSDTRVFEEQR